MIKLYRARSLEKVLDTPAKIFYKYEGVSPTGSHKPNTAIPQAFYNKKEGITKCKWFSLSELVITLKDSRPQTHYLLEFVLNDPSYKNYIKTKKNK